MQSKVFTSLGDVRFRRSETDGTPMMVVSLGDRNAELPLRSFQREFGIADDSADGRMLGLIAESLDFVNGLQPGDRLPEEVLTGRASWRPDGKYLRIAAGKLRLQLMAWVDASSANENPDANILEQLESEPALRAQVQRAFDQAAAALGLADSEDVVTLVEQFAEELSYIEALREELLGRAKTMSKRIDALGFQASSSNDRRAMLVRVRRLLSLALQQLSARFMDVDAQTGEVMATLRNADSQRSYIRSNRDWLYRTRRAWDPVLAEWQSADAVLDDATWQRIARAYRFLAQRYMPAKEWESVHVQRSRAGALKAETVMRW